MIKRCITTIGLIAIWMAMVSIAPAIEVAPRISDREIIEGLSALKQGNRDLNDRMGDLNQSVNKRIDGTNKRIDDLTQSMNIRFSDLQQNMNQRFAVNDQRFMAIEQRFDGLQNLIVALFGSVMALIIMLIGYMIWDRKTAQQPMQKRMAALEKQVDPNDTDHSILARMLAVQRIMAQDDPKLAETLRSQALL